MIVLMLRLIVKYHDSFILETHGCLFVAYDNDSVSKKLTPSRVYTLPMSGRRKRMCVYSTSKETA